ncbi:MgtC/SapB family protein [Segetibacter sp.]|jgi:putative Mg2+ transporter-C (MgtC) family protein|uniref:MgtC/SapB family protein n=1 Tax=Segetibacter sp. TaxID=2231182 RepID=UPI002621C496|nr:MgtC/SapB family protein [Segetibacter sp.]MCW3079432.1 MgtC/SapB transporter [Segetibacter sp.]
MEFLLEREDLISIGLSILCGAIIGFEREYNNKSAGFRTIILICLGSTIFTIVSKHGSGSDDRISANIITGIGFIGAGVIFKDKLSVLGLTTAAVIWTTAGIGMATGIGYHFLAFSLTIFTIIVLSLFGRIEYLIDRLNHTRTINITFKDADISNIKIIEKYLLDRRMKSKRIMMNKSKGQLFAILKVRGTERQFVLLNEELIKTENIVEYY